MAGRFAKRFELPASDLQRLMSCIVEHARPDEARAAERALGVLASLSTTTPVEGDETLSFVAPRGTAELIERALEGMARSDRHVDRARRFRAGA